jgi:predicted LPLAT superfamily acyltransferase
MSAEINAAKNTHWSEQPEQASRYWHVRLLLILVKCLPMIIVYILTFPVALSYFIVSKKSREASRSYLKKAASFINRDGQKMLKANSLKHFHAFALTVVEKVEAWGGKVLFRRIHFQEDDIADLIKRLETGEGALLICSHLGNAELLRALADFNRTGVSRKIPVTSIVDFKVSAYFNNMLRELNPDSMTHIIGADDIGPDAAILLQERISAGELVVIAGDRTSANTRNKYFLFPFLGYDAPFGYGPFFLAALLDAPTFFVFALRRKDVSLSSQYNMYVHKSPVSFDCPRRERDARIEETARLFAADLERHCAQHPYQWYNFYDFWAQPESANGIDGGAERHAKETI